MFTVKVTDGEGNVETQVVTVTVVPVNDQPSFTLSSDQTVSEDSGVASVSGFVSSLTLGPADEQAGGDNAQSVDDWVLTTDNSSLFSVQPDITAGVLTFTPAANATGLANVTGAIRPVLGFPGCFVDRGVCWLCDLKW